jgi:sulfate adenylyltransferase
MVLARRGDGICIWLTGLSGAGKSTTADLLTARLEALGRTVTLLDGDVVRANLSQGLGFSRADRDTNIRRIAFVASEIVRHRGTVVVAVISPYRSTRAEARRLVGDTHFIEVFVDTPLDVCERRDPKGLYAKARRGEIERFTGIDDPYEAPEADVEMVLDTVANTPTENVECLIEDLRMRGFLARPGQLGRGSAGSSGVSGVSAADSSPSVPTM